MKIHLRGTPDLPSDGFQYTDAEIAQCSQLPDFSFSAFRPRTPNLDAVLGKLPNSARTSLAVCWRPFRGKEWRLNPMDLELVALLNPIESIQRKIYSGSWMGAFAPLCIPNSSPIARRCLTGLSQVGLFIHDSSISIHSAFRLCFASRRTD